MEQCLRALLLTLASASLTLAEGSDFAAVMTWITAHDGTPEALSAAPKPGLHGSRINDGGAAGPRAPLRFVLPPGALAEPPQTAPGASL